MLEFYSTRLCRTRVAGNISLGCEGSLTGNPDFERAVLKSLFGDNNFSSKEEEPLSVFPDDTAVGTVQVSDGYVNEVNFKGV